MPELPDSYFTDPLVKAMVRRVDRAMDDLDAVLAAQAMARDGSHTPTCWQRHTACLARRIQHQLTTEEPS